MQNDVILERMDDCEEESRWIRKGDITIEAFDYMGSLWPLHPGRNYLVDLNLQQLDFDEPIVISKINEMVEKIGVTFGYYLYGHVKNNMFYVGEFQFDFSRYNDYDQYQGKYLKFKADRINVEFLKELPSQNNR